MLSATQVNRGRSVRAGMSEGRAAFYTGGGWVKRDTEQTLESNKGVSWGRTFQAKGIVKCKNLKGVTQYVTRKGSQCEESTKRRNH